MGKLKAIGLILFLLLIACMVITSWSTAQLEERGINPYLGEKGREWEREHNQTPTFPNQTIEKPASPVQELPTPSPTVQQSVPGGLTKCFSSQENFPNGKWYLLGEVSKVTGRTCGSKEWPAVR
jgi:hypothetical protein